MRKKKVSVWKCNYCGYTVKVDEAVYREWRKRISSEDRIRFQSGMDKVNKEMKAHGKNTGDKDKGNGSTERT